MIGFRIAQRTRKVDADTAARFRALPVANISDSMSRMTAGGPLLRPMHAGGALAGPAFTVKTRPGDNLMIHKALDLIEPGDLIVGDGDGVLCVPFAETAEIYKAAKAKNDAEQQQIAAIREGRSDRAWVDATLKRLGVLG